MDYKELIDNVRNARNYSKNVLHEPFVEDVLLRAASALEILLAERDATIDTLNYGGCSTCKYQNLGWDSKPCMFCHHSRGTSGNWEWKGPQISGVRVDFDSAQQTF